MKQLSTKSECLIEKDRSGLPWSIKPVFQSAWVSDAP